MHPVSVTPWSLLLALLGARQACAAPSINVDMKAAFSPGPYLIELLETAASENSTCYFPLLDRIASGYFAAANSEEELYHSFLTLVKDDGHLGTPDALSTFNFALALRSAAPRVEAHYQYYSNSVESALNHGDTPDCDDWVLLGEKRYCSPSLETPVEGVAYSSSISELPFDRSLGQGEVAILYADIESPKFASFHDLLAKQARKGRKTYRLRYRRNSIPTTQAVSVSGYGVELALKKTDYIVIDDRESSQDQKQKPLASNVELDEDEEVADLTPLSQSELSSLGLKAASFILGSDDPFESLVKLSQDFPKFSSSIAAHEVSEKFEAQRGETFGREVPAGANYLWINGLQLTERQIQAHNLVDVLRRERKLINGVRDLGFSGHQAVKILSYQGLANSKDDHAERYDWTDKQEDHNAILWLNDLEKDAMYDEYPKNLMGLLQRTYPGQIPPIGLNLFHLVLPVDLSDAEDLSVVAQISMFISRGLPIRVGLVPLGSTDKALDQAKVTAYLLDTYGRSGVVNYIQTLLEKSKTAPSDQLLSDATKELNQTEDAVVLSLQEISNSESYAERCSQAKHWASRLRANPAKPFVLANGIAVPRDEQWLQAISGKLSGDLQVLQQGIYRGSITDDMDVSGIFLAEALASRNTYISSEDDSLNILDVGKVFTEHETLFKLLPTIEHNPVTMKDTWGLLSVVADLTTNHGLQLVLDSLQFRRNNLGVQLDLIHNPLDVSDANLVNWIFKPDLEQLIEAKTIEDLKSLHGSPTAGDHGLYLDSLDKFLRSAKIQPGESRLILNGRVIGPFTLDDPFTAEDFQHFFEYEQKHRIQPVLQALDALSLDQKISGPKEAAKITSITALSTISDTPEGIFESTPSARLDIWYPWDSEHTAIESGNPDTASIHIVGLLNPVSEQGQKWAPILKVLSELDGVYLKLFLNPKLKIEELPVKRFFRYVLDSKPRFGDDGKLLTPHATFKGVPSEALLTLGVDVPPAWLVSSKESVQDLDNIKIGSADTDIFATYELEHILIEGHSSEASGTPPRGAQLVLSTDKDPLLDDTIIMANLGFFQFKANPGLYNIRLKQGRSAEIFEIASLGTDGRARHARQEVSDESTQVALIDFQGTTLYPRLNRRPGMEEEEVLEKPAEGDNIVSKGLKYAESLFGSAKSKSVSAETHAEINIFSVASGHLYERMLNIMMVSVMKHTSHTVKFWFIEQFLSPSFKEFIPHLAAQYGFKYEMVTYKWPHWLRQQKEKQREIWGYKILFLDVLFPLSLDKVIFVDADQIVRTDMISLVNHDLEGAPYGFTPMCDSRTEMEGFRFWKQGYWANYLRGKPYHISALYVVDLRRFRELAAGDRLRQQYHTLSADPGSLSNLDQDLPNHMQFQIPIHSLPQEWLWCETWCSDEALEHARTIDLCNNPQTKEPKLDRARRQVPEWTEYDEEIAAVARKVKEGSEGGDQDQKLEKHEGEEKTRGVNTKSRRFEEPVRTKDEL